MSLQRIIIGILIFIVVGLGFYFFDNRGAENLTARPSSTSSLQPAQVIPSGWQTHRDERLNFSVSYPPDFEISPNGDNSILVVKKVTEPGQGPANFVYISVVPE